ncbi:MAG: signal peptidase II [Micrococcales bacterium]|nr:signal peptidase II [Micrococcales bacterium]
MTDLAASRRLARVWLACVAALTFLVDLLTKIWALSHLDDGHTDTVIPGLIRLELIGNGGAAFSLGENMTWVFTVVATVISVAVVIAARHLASRPWGVAFGLVLGGALGNLVDRIARPPGFPQGHVVDFIAYGSWFIGNVADIAIVAAAGLVIVLAFRGVRARGPA